MLATMADALVYARHVGESGYELVRVPFDGGEDEILYESGEGRPTALAVDEEGALYWTDILSQPHMNAGHGALRVLVR
jgi:hypothetical protein